MISFFAEEPPPSNSNDFERRIRGYFSPEGPLSRSKGYEYRPQQEDMAGLVAKALFTTRPLLVEAGTGVGKSLAYLVPSIDFGLDKKRKVLISTHTINLQEQLIHKDLPNAQRVLGRNFKAELFKGRGNYLCPRRLKHAFAAGADLFDNSAQGELKALWEWSQETKDGSLSDLPTQPSSRVWAQICSEAQICTPRTCPPESGCFYQAARRRAQEAEVLVLNHTLFFTLLSSMPDEPEHRGFLFPNDFVVLDEAHTLEDVAAKQLGLNLSESSLSYQLHRLYNPRSKRGYFTALSDSAGRKEVERVLEHTKAFFENVAERCHFKGASREFRVLEPGLAGDTLSPLLESINLRLADATARMEQGSQQRLELQDLFVRMRDYRLGLETFLEQSAEEHVYWVEQRGEGDALALRNAPLDLAERLGKIFFREGRTCILTSATLSAGDSKLSYFRGRVGAKFADVAQIGSPFDFKKQMKLYLVKSIPEQNQPDYETVLEQWIKYFLTMTDGRAFVLFTSYRLLEAMTSRLESYCQKKGWPLFVQGRGLSRHQMLRDFKEGGNCVLFGTESFWTGVDVPGEALSNVIVTRLPFSVPSAPITEARMQKLDSEGVNSFFNYYVPEAIIKLRQGVGRLIRSKKDTGICVILDDRVLTKGYGKQFLAALPNCNHIVMDAVPSEPALT